MCGLSIDFGPFAFMDNFDPSYTPNHDDHMLRYSYRNQPTIIWWNLVRFGEAVAELMGAGGAVDDASFITEGVKEEQKEEIISRAEKLIMQAGDEFKHTFLTEYKRLMTTRLGFQTAKETDFDQLFSPLLDTLEALELDFNHFFRRLSSLKLADIGSREAKRDKASIFFHKEGVPKTTTDAEGRDRVADLLEKWETRIVEDWAAEERDTKRIDAMKGVNPNFVPRGWILDEVISRVEKDKERNVLQRVMQMALNPFEDEWHGKMFNGEVYNGDHEEEQRWVGDVPNFGQGMQCSCSS